MLSTLYQEIEAPDHAHDDEAQYRLWDICERLVGCLEKDNLKVECLEWQNKIPRILILGIFDHFLIKVLEQIGSQISLTDIVVLSFLLERKWLLSLKTVFIKE